MVDTNLLLWFGHAVWKRNGCLFAALPVIMPLFSGEPTPVGVGVLIVWIDIHDKVNECCWHFTRCNSLCTNVFL